MHLQRAPHAETKLVRCTRGAVFDVLLDLRRNSATYRHWRAAELTEDNGLALYIPAGFAHGFQSLADDTEVLYQITERHAPELSVGYAGTIPRSASNGQSTHPYCLNRTPATKTSIRPFGAPA